MKIGMSTNEYGTPVSVHICETCGDEFTVCPAIPDERADDWRGCLAESCGSYDPARDADKLFESKPWAIQRESVEET